MKEPKSNEAFVTELMTRSQHRALAQLFVIDAISKYADAVSRADPASVDSPLISGEAWVAVAREIKAKIDMEYGKKGD